MGYIESLKAIPRWDRKARTWRVQGDAPLEERAEVLAEVLGRESWSAISCRPHNHIECARCGELRERLREATLILADVLNGVMPDPQRQRLLELLS